MQKFWTVTDNGTTNTNSRSTRFSSIEEAIDEATYRINKGRAESVCILECVKIVKRANAPVIVEDATNKHG